MTLNYTDEIYDLGNQLQNGLLTVNEWKQKVTIAQKRRKKKIREKKKEFAKHKI
jgi:hypothetical protein